MAIKYIMYEDLTKEVVDGKIRLSHAEGISRLVGIEGIDAFIELAQELVDDEEEAGLEFYPIEEDGVDPPFAYPVSLRQLYEMRSMLAGG